MLTGPRLPLPPPKPIDPFGLASPYRRLAGSAGAFGILGNRPKPGQGDALYRRQATAQALAKQFCAATLEKRFGTDEQQVLQILQDVHREGVKPEFELAVINEARRHGEIVNDASEIIQDEFKGNVFEHWFKTAPRKEALDYMATGRNQYRGSGWDYRRYGMYRSLADFASVCKEYPIMSATVIGAVAALGGIFPFLGAISGVAIMGWAGAFTAVNEIQAARKGKAMNAEKAEHYMASGENMAAFLLTASGFHGIRDGNKMGVAAWRNALNAKENQSASWLVRHGNGLKAAIKEVDSDAIPDWARTVYSKIKGVSPKAPSSAAVRYGHAPKSTDAKEHWTLAWSKRFLFVVGLFDNVLLPFNWLADQLSGKPQKPKG